MTGHRGKVADNVLAVLVCPDCGARVAPGADGVRCGTGHLMPWRDGYLDAAGAGPAPDPPTCRTFDSFGFEWSRFSAPRPEDEVFWGRYFADVDLTELAGRMGLDAGCGQGRYSRMTAGHLAGLIALDGSEAVRAAAVNLAGLPGVVVVRADLRQPPIAPASIGFVSCLGVLHHLSDPRAGFDVLARLLAPGGLILVYLYSRAEGRGARALGLTAAGALRRVTVHLPHRTLRFISWPVAALLYVGLVAPGAIGERRRPRRLATLPLATYRGQPLRSLWLDTFDRLSAPLESRYRLADVEPWFRENDLVIEAVNQSPDLAGLTILARARAPVRP